MSDQRLSNPYASPATAGDPTITAVKPDARLAAAFLSQAFLWMFVGLLVSAGVAYWVTQSEALTSFAEGNLFFLFIAQLGIVFAIGLFINRINATVALGLFFVYAASLGLTIGLIVSSYSTTAVATSFISASAMFGAAAVYGTVTKRSLSSLGGILLMGLVGIIVASIINIFLGSEAISWLISLAGVAIFTALTAYDVQKIQQGALVGMTGSMEKAAVLGALRLYLDFINLFLFTLRLFGGGGR
jgi:FtsH-binding integral membrane protein